MRLAWLGLYIYIINIVRAWIYICMTTVGLLAAHVRRGVAITEQAEEVLCAAAAAAEVCGAVAPTSRTRVLAAHRHRLLHTARQA